MLNGIQMANLFLTEIFRTETFRLALVIPTWKGFVLLPVLGYIDPNTGGMIFQILAVLFAAFSGFFLIFSGRIKTAYYKMRRRLGKSAPEEMQGEDVTDENVEPPSQPGKTKEDN